MYSREQKVQEYSSISVLELILIILMFRTVF